MNKKYVLQVFTKSCEMFGQFYFETDKELPIETNSRKFFDHVFDSVRQEKLESFLCAVMAYDINKDMSFYDSKEFLNLERYEIREVTFEKVTW
jgi:hypothetical protein